MTISFKDERNLPFIMMDQRIWKSGLMANEIAVCTTALFRLHHENIDNDKMFDDLGLSKREVNEALIGLLEKGIITLLPDDVIKFLIYTW